MPTAEAVSALPVSMSESSQPLVPKGSKQTARLWIKLALFLVVLSATGALLSELPLHTYLLQVSAWIKAHTLLGAVLVIIIFWVAIPLCIPSTVIETLTGSLFGVGYGVVVILIGKTGGSLVAFMIGRSLGKEVIGDYLTNKFPTFRALSDVLNGSSWKPLLLFQLSSLPNMLKCYALAMTNVSRWRFALSSMIGGSPYAFIWAYIGEEASDLALLISGSGEVSSTQYAVIIMGGICTALAMALLIVYTRRELGKMQLGVQPEQDEQDAAATERDDEPLLHTSQTSDSVAVNQ